MVRRRLSHQSHLSGRITSSPRDDASRDAPSMASSIYNQMAPSQYHHGPRHMHHNQLAHVEGPVDTHYFKENRFSSGSGNIDASTIRFEECPTYSPKFKVPLTRHDVYASDAISSGPADFAELFSPNRKLFIHHDDATSDGNMHLRVDTVVSNSCGRSQKVILFHLQMHDLKDRHFSLQRHCRDSEWTICSSSREYAPALPATRETPPYVQQSLGQPMQSLVLKQDAPITTRGSNMWQDPGYDPIARELRCLSPAGLRSSKMPIPQVNLIRLDFWNDAYINISRQGSGRSKRYEYDFLGTKYEWKRQLCRGRHFQEFSYHLINAKTSRLIAHITPEPLTAKEAQEEQDFGGWVPPCTMQIIDRRVFQTLSGVADTIVATGLTAMVDDCIERRWHSKQIYHLDLPTDEAADELGPAQLIDEVFNRRAFTAHHRC